MSEPSSSSSTGPGGENWAVIINQRLSGMPKPGTLAEWQLQAVLFHSKLTQYYQKFISLGGDDVDQLMQSDESEFLEIMKLIGMASKPLHVRRFQRTLQEFSRDRSAFLQQAVTNIGPPPIDFPTSSTTTPMQAALQFLLPHGSTSTVSSTIGISGEILSPPKLTSSFFQTSPSSSLINATISMLPIAGVDSLNLVSTNPFVSLPSSSSIIPSPIIAGQSQTQQQQSTSRTQSPAIGTTNIASPSSESDLQTDQSFEGGVLPEADIPIIQQLSKHLFDSIPNLKNLEPRYVQNKKRLPKELLDVMIMSSTDSTRMLKFREFSAIYGRYDAKRKPDKPLSYHELLVNEAAAQLCLLQPVLLTRRDELFPLARKVVRASNFSGYRTIPTTMTNIERKRPVERSQTPESATSNRSSPEVSSSDRKRSLSTTDTKSSASKTTTSASETKKSKNE